MMIIICFLLSNSIPKPPASELQQKLLAALEDLAPAQEQPQCRVDRRPGSGVLHGVEQVGVRPKGVLGVVAQKKCN